ncbi:cupin domain-containing protein [Thermodesulfobacteriota bacterium]
MEFMNIEEIPGVVPPKHYDLLGRPLVNESMGVKDFKVSYTRMEKTGRCDPHIHENAEQLFIILEGAMMFVGEQGERPVNKGEAVLVKRGEVHSNYNIADDETVYLTVTSVPKP